MVVQGEIEPLTQGFSIPYSTDPYWPKEALQYLGRATAREQLRNAYSAIIDVGICAVILDHICQEPSIKTIKNLYAESEKVRTPTTMPFGKHKGMLLADVPSGYKQRLLTQGDIDHHLRKALAA